MTRWPTGLALLVVLALVAGMNPAGAGAAPARGGALTIVIGSDPSSLDPHRTPSVNIAHSVMYETLVTVDRRTGEFIPALAESWEVSRDGTAITFKLSVNFSQPYMQDVYYDKFGNLLLLDAYKAR